MDNILHPEGVSVHAGFPNAADDSRLKGLSLDTLLVKNPNSTFYFQVSGNLWQNIGIFDGDVALVDRALVPHGNDMVVWHCEGEFAISSYTHMRRNATLWGTVTTVIHIFKQEVRRDI